MRICLHKYLDISQIHSHYGAELFWTKELMSHGLNKTICCIMLHTGAYMFMCTYTEFTVSLVIYVVKEQGLAYI